MSIYNERTRHVDPDSVTHDQPARVAAAMYYLANYLNFDTDGLSSDLDRALDDCLPEGATNGDGIKVELDDELRKWYRTDPEACLSLLASEVAARRKREKAA